MKKIRIASIILSVTLIILSFCGCAYIDISVHSLKGSLIGVSYTAEFYDNYGAKFLNVTGDNIDISGNLVEEMAISSDGNSITNYSLSSVITITIDGKQMESCGNTVIFTETGLKRDVEFNLTDIESESGGDLASLTSISKVVNKYKNFLGIPQVVVIQSQLGVPICAYSGNEVYWEIPDNLSKMTKLMIDGKAL